MPRRWPAESRVWGTEGLQLGSPCSWGQVVTINFGTLKLITVGVSHSWGQVVTINFGTLGTLGSGRKVDSYDLTPGWGVQGVPRVCVPGCAPSRE